MILITHAITGAALGSLSPTSLAAFLAGLVSHYFLDAIPHYDYVDERFISQPGSNRSRQIFWIIILDGLVGTLLGLWIFFGEGVLFAGPIGVLGENFTSAAYFWRIFLGLVGGLLPDALQGVQLYWPNKITAWHNHAHHFLHFLINDRPLLQTHPLIGLLLQAAIGVLFVCIAL